MYTYLYISAKICPTHLFIRKESLKFPKNVFTGGCETPSFCQYP